MTLRAVAFANGELGRRIVGSIARSGELSAVFVHPESRASERASIAAIAMAAGAQVVEAAGSSAERAKQLRMLGELDLGVSAGFGMIMRPAEFQYPRFGTVNLHMSLLPFNRGAHPNAWAIADGTPAGVTLHFVDEGVDTGDILIQRSTDFDFEDTAQTLYAKLLDDAAVMFEEFWPKSESYWRDPPRRRQLGGGTSHRVADLERLEVPSGSSVVTVGDLLRVLRARTFPPYSGARFEDGGRRFRLRLEIERDD